MMEVVIPAEIEKDPAFAVSVASATRYINKELKSSVLTPKANWELRKDILGKPELELEIADGPDSVSHRFTPAELMNTWRVEGRLNLLWDQLLGKRLERHQERLGEMLREMEGNGM